MQKCRDASYTCSKERLLDPCQWSQYKVYPIRPNDQTSNAVNILFEELDWSYTWRACICATSIYTNTAALYRSETT